MLDVLPHRKKSDPRPAGMDWRKTCLCILLFWVVLGMGDARAEGISPVLAVKQFTENYGGPRMDESARWTTARFRDHRPRSVWVVDTWRQLQRLAYKRLQETVSVTETNETEAAVVLRTRIETLAGETRQKEIYYLIKEDDTWLIDALHVVDEDVQISAEELSL